SVVAALDNVVRHSPMRDARPSWHGRSPCCLDRESNIGLRPLFIRYLTNHLTTYLTVAFESEVRFEKV
ncbi:MAG: hypothetical protein ACOY3Z_05705, partial [Thermodesulfobacteriota bacterium]